MTDDKKVENEYPLISSIMIVQKPDLTKLDLAINNFTDQTYPYKELIIVNNSNTQLEASEITIKARKNVFLLDTPNKCSAGQARNYGISACNGQILAQFDMDCWHDPKRLEIQVATMAENGAHICMLSKALSYSFNSGRASYWENEKKAILNTMVFARPSQIDYPDYFKNEEFGILNKMTQSNMGAISIEKPELVCKLHFSNDPITSIAITEINEEHSDIINKIIKIYE